MNPEYDCGFPQYWDDSLSDYLYFYRKVTNGRGHMTLWLTRTANAEDSIIRG